ncbi:folylpolyglutamate synthase/dihydrofolate synthase family protein [Sphingobacterium sp. UGAL515B_05]|uniref:bifunctional folylpolyglutamate synthase/dihydrofolate synthase n=1 Tax=Sphingobacterium sp. UGAL515B_05 TaxID=2986767 RepID=UPI0029535A10|nr:folylpolyglutamate synthase/dihydrofolate synthase family protein [Sphingobacterium sp. UGAL515B_05]WON96946.1 bifunctional folylpolyglutamate synthase/dihydrofolate synthase [Sphingobacterium sp. UGAL515B_05]
MNAYNEAIEYLYTRLPMFTRDGASAFKKDLDNTIKLCAALDNPQRKFKTLHIAGTNGKGSTSHMLAAILAEAGYKTGLYTSPHLLDFRERIRVNGQLCEKEFVVDFVNTHRELIEEVSPSFFEITVAMAFDYFEKNKVDIAVIEVGLGGRLDSTNIIQPLLSVITNIGFDHMNLLGNTLAEIAAEKAGIIKRNTPVVISEYAEETAAVFLDKAAIEHAPIQFASDNYETKMLGVDQDYLTVQARDTAGHSADYQLDLKGSYQVKNLAGVLLAVDELRQQGFEISDQHVHQALKNVQATTGIQGRWQQLSKDPFIICDTGHNEDGIHEVLKNLATTAYDKLHFVIGAMRDKDLSHMLPYLPKDATYYFSAPDMPRAMPSEELRKEAMEFGLTGLDYASVGAAFDAAKEAYQQGNLIFVGGSNFVVAEVLARLTQE